MSFRRGWAAFNLQMPSEIPHTQYTMHAPWLEHLRRKHGKPGAGFEELLDFDFAWHVDGPAVPKPGRWTDMGHAVFAADGSDYRLPKASPFADLEEIFNLDPFEEYGRGDVKSKAQEYQAWHREARKGDYVIPNGTYNSVISFAIAAFGWENLLLAAGTDPQRFGEMLNRWADYLMQWVEAQAMTDIPIFHTHDDMVWTAGGIFSPEFYRAYVFPNYKRYWDCSRNAGKKVLFTSDGNYTQYLDDVAAAGAEGQRRLPHPHLRGQGRRLQGGSAVHGPGARLPGLLLRGGQPHRPQRTYRERRRLHRRLLVDEEEIVSGDAGKPAGQATTPDGCERKHQGTERPEFGRAFFGNLCEASWLRLNTGTDKDSRR
jgi:hypothetical protein